MMQPPQSFNPNLAIKKIRQIVLSHEGIGVVTKTGPDVQNLENGDHVAWGLIQDTCQIFEIQGELSDEEAAMLMCARATVFNILIYYGTKPTDRDGVIGVGGIGHLTIQFASKMGYVEEAAGTALETAKMLMSVFGTDRLGNESSLENSSATIKEGCENDVGEKIKESRGKKAREVDSCVLDAVQVDMMGVDTRCAAIEACSLSNTQMYLKLNNLVTSNQYLTKATMTTIRLQTKAMKAIRARNERARRCNAASIQAALASDGRRKSTFPAQSVVAVKSEKLKIRNPGPNNAIAAVQAAPAAEPKKYTIRIPGPKKANASAQTISAGRVKVEEDADDAAASVVLARTLPYKPTRSRFTPGKPAVIV
ncbi:hypothetical protein BPAE_0005g00240 [Botrytis paeoniae]|uniref:Uncharacterized protein n=1 Tax=Botrytis paeoniae TaxID=278948 RepID=A0A4Z1G4I4_9HELO|nr:hypothetical protein BPAE_0005g00240 [Botrytis paeoniae]